jgi:hypothetical protein
MLPGSIYTDRRGHGPQTKASPGPLPKGGRGRGGGGPKTLSPLYTSGAPFVPFIASLFRDNRGRIFAIQPHPRTGSMGYQRFFSGYSRLVLKFYKLYSILNAYVTKRIYLFFMSFLVLRKNNIIQNMT